MKKSQNNITDNEAMVPHIKRRSKEQRKIKIPVLNFLLVLFCVFILICSTFIQLDITHPIIPNLFSGKHLVKSDFFYTYSIIPQVPAVLFIIGLLGRKMGLTSIILYILLGLFALPIFALGGGFSYITEPSFGYILAYIPAGYFAGSVIKEEFSIINILKAGIIGVLIIHITGIIYMLCVALFKENGWAFIKGWILTQSMLKFAYDYILSIIALIVAKYGNKFVKYLIG